MDEIIKIDLFGEEFRFKPGDQVKDPNKVAKSLTDYIQRAERMVPNKNSSRNRMVVLLLAAMNLSKDYHELKIRYAELEKDMENKISSLMDKIDNDL